MSLRLRGQLRRIPDLPAPQEVLLIGFLHIGHNRLGGILLDFPGIAHDIPDAQIATPTTRMMMR